MNVEANLKPIWHYIILVWLQLCTNYATLAMGIYTNQPPWTSDLRLSDSVNVSAPTRLAGVEVGWKLVKHAMVYPDEPLKVIHRKMIGK